MKRRLAHPPRRYALQLDTALSSYLGNRLIRPPSPRSLSQRTLKKHVAPKGKNDISAHLHCASFFLSSLPSSPFHPLFREGAFQKKG